MFNMKVNGLFFAALASFLMTSSGTYAQDCPSCAQKNSVQYARGNARLTQREVVSPVVKNYDCANPQPYEYISPEPMPQPVRRVRRLSDKVEYVPYVERNNEKVLRPLTTEEVSERLGPSNGYMVDKVNASKYVMSSRDARGVKVDPSYRDGSIFGGKPCNSRENGGILGGGSCGHTSKNKGIFGGESCTSCAKQKAPVRYAAAPQPPVVVSPVPMVAPVPAPVRCPNWLATTVTYTKLPCVGRGHVPCHRSAAPCMPMTQVTTQPIPCPQVVTSPVPCPKIVEAPVEVKVPAPCPCAQEAVELSVEPCPCAKPKMVGVEVVPEPCPCVKPKPIEVKAEPCPCAKPKPAPRPLPVVVENVRDCSMFAPISMEWVDFRLQKRSGLKNYARNLGNYRFKIFGCRNAAKSTVLSEGRIVEKDINFNEIFKDMVSDCYKVVNTQECIDENSVIPEYVLTAEITDYFMNMCNDALKSTGNRGSSEMKVVWRLMDASKTNVLWKGETIGRAKLFDGDKNDEMLLIQRAFANASENLRFAPGFEKQLAVRVTPEEMARQRLYLMEMQRISGICQPAVVEDSGVISGGYTVVETPVETPAVEVAVETPEPEVVIEAPAPEKPVEVKPVTSSAIFEADKICIVEREDAGTLTPDNLPMIRKSIVSVKNANGEEGVGLLISEQFVMTSADLVVRDNNQYTVKTTDGKTVSAKAFRANPRRNTALLVLNETVEYTPLALNLELPAVDRDSYLSVGALAFADDDKYLQNTSRINSYRYAEDGTAEIVVDSFDYGTTTGSTLVDENGKVVALAHRKQANSGDLFLPFETAMRSLGVEICGKEFPEPAPKVEEKVWRKPVAEFIDEPEAKAPEQMPVKNRK